MCFFIMVQGLALHSWELDHRVGNYSTQATWLSLSKKKKKQLRRLFYKFQREDKRKKKTKSEMPSIKYIFPWNRRGRLIQYFKNDNIKR